MTNLIREGDTNASSPDLVDQVTGILGEVAADPAIRLWPSLSRGRATPRAASSAAAKTEPGDGLQRPVSPASAGQPDP